MYVRSLDPSVLEFSLSLYRHPIICILFSSRFTSYNKQTNHYNEQTVYRLIINKVVLAFCLSLYRYPLTVHVFSCLYLSFYLSFIIQSKVGHILTKSESLRINLNIDGSPIVSRSHTHPSVDPSVLGFSPTQISPTPTYMYSLYLSIYLLFIINFTKMKTRVTPRQHLGPR